MKNQKPIDAVLFYLSLPFLPIVLLGIAIGCYAMKSYVWIKEQHKGMTYDMPTKKRMHNRILGGR